MAEIYESILDFYHLQAQFSQQYETPDDDESMKFHRRLN